MGRAFHRLQKQVNGRSGTRGRYIPVPARMRELEVVMLELLAYMAREVANDEQSPSDQALIEAYTAFKKHLEGTVV